MALLHKIHHVGAISQDITQQCNNRPCAVNMIYSTVENSVKPCKKRIKVLVKLQNSETKKPTNNDNKQ